MRHRVESVELRELRLKKIKTKEELLKKLLMRISGFFVEIVSDGKNG